MMAMVLSAWAMGAYVVFAWLAVRPGARKGLATVHLALWSALCWPVYFFANGVGFIVTRSIKAR